MTSTRLARSRKQKPETTSRSARKRAEGDGLFTSWLSPSSRVNGATPAVSPSALQTSGLLDQFPTPLVESLRYLVGRFQLGQDVELRTRLGVVSALHGEGVTTISRTLAAVIASDLDMRVCWVDLSWASPRSPEAVEPPGPDGIYEVLTGGIELASALQWSGDPRLAILRAGRVADTQRQALARSPRLGTVLDDLEKRFDCVVFDMPPILTGSAGLGLARRMGSYLLVVRHGVTTTRHVRATVEELRTVPSLGVVLNRFKSRIPKWFAHFFAV